MNWELIISCLALGVSVFTYFKHDKKIKAQEQIRGRNKTIDK